MRRIRGYINILLVLILFVFIGINRVNAATLSVKSTTVMAGKTFTLTVSDTNSNSLYSLNYDTTLLSKQGSVGNGYNVSGLKELKGDGKIVFEVTPNLKQDTTITFVLTDQNEYDVTEHITINLKAKASNTTTKPVVTTTKEIITTTTTTTKPTTTTTKQEIVTTTTNKTNSSASANLKTLKVYSSSKELMDLNPIFNPTVYDYTVSVNNNISKVLISATTEDPNSIVIIDNGGSIELVDGQENIANVLVTAKDGLQNSYKIRFLKDALDSTTLLKSIMIDEDEEFTLVKDKYQYDIYVNKDVERLTISYEKVSEDSVVIISGNNDLKEGSKVKILITASNGDKKEYILNIIKSERPQNNITVEVKKKNPLIIMGLGMTAFILIGGIVYIIKNR